MILAMILAMIFWSDDFSDDFVSGKYTHYFWTKKRITTTEKWYQRHLLNKTLSVQIRLKTSQPGVPGPVWSKKCLRMSNTTNPWNAIFEKRESHFLLANASVQDRCAVDGKEVGVPETEFLFLSVKSVSLNTVVNINAELFLATS